MHVKSTYGAQFEEMYIIYYARMKRFTLAYLIHEEDAENIVQDIFLEFWEKQFAKYPHQIYKRIESKWNVGFYALCIFRRYTIRLKDFKCHKKQHK